MDCAKNFSKEPIGTETTFSLNITGTQAKCPIGETVGTQNLEAGKIPVFSCEGACIRGEIARLAANRVAKAEPYRRGCHGELLTVPHSAISKWARNMSKVVLIDGCFLRCHGRMMEHLFDKNKLVQFDAFSHYKKYTDIFYSDVVPEEERDKTASEVASWVIESLDG